jgi:hypothetical protein
MSSHPLFLIDVRRARQFTLLGQAHRLFHAYETWTDADGLAWAGVRLHEHAFAVTWLGPGWVFDAFAGGRRAEDLAAKQQAMGHADAEEHRRQLAKAVQRVRPGRHGERLLTIIHQQVLAAGCSVFRIADFELATAVWGSARTAWPRHWRQDLQAILSGLSWLHVADWPEGNRPVFGTDTALFTHVADLRSSAHDECDPKCPGRNGPRHNHYLINIGQGFLGCLEELAQPDPANGIRRYDFTSGAHKRANPNLRRLGKTGRLIFKYGPAILGDPEACATLTPQQHDLLQAIVRETTRASKKDRACRGVAEIFTGNQIPDRRGKRLQRCPLLDSRGEYVGFNGNKRRKGLGYRLLTPGGWLAKAGYPVHKAKAFLDDLGTLSSPLGLQVVGVGPSPTPWLDLARLQSLSQALAGRSMLDKVHLRIYSKADYLQCWDAYFHGPCDDSTRLNARAAGIDILLQCLQQNGTRRSLAQALEVDPSFLGKVLDRKKPCPTRLAERATRLLNRNVACKTAPPCVSGSSLRATQAPTALLDVARACLQRGWSVVPQLPGAKHPCVKWKPYKEALPSDADWQTWARLWPQAGLALVLGPVSGIFAVDVDGTDAHQELIQRLSGEPLAPKSLSGSRQPNRYHLFFRHPGVLTKAKATPWHPKLEFRSKGGIVIIPPSKHKSGHCYVWAPGQSPDELAFPDLPDQVLRALASPKRVLVPAAPVPVSSSLDMSPSTHAFLSGQNANGPGWNERLFRAACDLCGRGMDLGQAEPLLLAGAQPWDETEQENARRTIASAYAGHREPGIW